MDRARQELAFRGTARFDIAHLIGSGGTGLVYDVFDRERAAHVALKTLHSFTPEALRRFKNEFRSLQDLQHPNLITLHELMEADGIWFFTMELIDGLDFLRYVRPVDGPPLDPQALRQVTEARPEVDHDFEDTLRTDESPVSVPGSVATKLYAGFNEVRLRDALRQLVLGLSALHDAGKVHRDIKPGNVLVTREGRVVILDFGLVTDPGSFETRAVGTVNYMAPEQAAALPVGPAADWYAVGVTLYRALTGVLPFTGTPDEIMQWKVDVDAPAPSELNPRIPTDLDMLCRLLMRRDPARRPDGRAILARLGESAPVAPPPSAFVGRSTELADLEAALGDSRRGAVAVLAHGESGVGKSALMRHFLDDVAAPKGALILAARCYERESTPYKAVDQAMDALARHLSELPAVTVDALLPPRMVGVADLFPVFLQVPAVGRAAAEREARITDATQARAFAFAALRSLFQRLAQARPLVLAIDDLQWADGDSLALLSELLAAPDAPPMLFCATVRAAPGAGAGVLDALRPRLGADVRARHVTGLPLSDARRLVEQLATAAGCGPDAVGSVGIAQVAEEAAGHPMFIDALVRYRLLRPDAIGPVRLEEAVRARFAALDAEARQVLDYVCIAGGPLPQEVCAEAAGMSFGDVAQRIHVLRAASLVKTGGIRRRDTVEPYHDRVREAVADALPDAQHGDIHARLARALEASGAADPEQLAVHFQRGGDPVRAARYASRAADRAHEALAFERAAELYRTALELEASPPARQRLRIRLAEALANGGRGALAAEELLEVADTAEPDLAIELRREAAAQYLRSGRFAEGVGAMTAVLTSVGMRVPQSRARALATFIHERVRLRLRGLDFVPRDEKDVSPDLLRRVQVCFSVYPLGLTDTLRGHPFQMRNLRLSLDAGVPAAIVRAMGPNMMFEATAGQRKAGEVDRLYALGQRLVAEVGDPYLDGNLGTAMAASEFLLGRWTAAIERSERSERILREQCTGVAWELDAAQIYGLRALFFAGRIADIRRRLPAAIKEAGDRGDLYLATYLRTGLPAAHAWLAADDPDTAARHSTEAMREWSYEGTHLQHVQALQGDLSVDLYRGDVAIAERRLAEMWPRLKAAMYLRIALAKVCLLHLRARVALAGAEQGGAEVQHRLIAATRDARALAACHDDWAHPLAALIDAGVAAIRGDAATAERLLADADAGLARLDMPLFAAAARRQRGLLLGGDEGGALVAAADGWMTSEGIARPARFADLLAPGFAPRRLLR